MTSTYDGKVNSQSYCVLLDTEGELLNKPKAYDLNVTNFIRFLDDEVAELKQKNQ